MTEPHDRIQAALEVLFAEFRLWQRQHMRLEDCHRYAENLQISDVYDNFLFNGFISTYNEAAGVFARYCEQGSTAAYRVAHTLRMVHDTFAAEEERNRNAMRGLS